VTTEILSTLLGLQAVVIGFLVRVLWRLNERIARLEGRLNGTPPPKPPHGR
jgi:hypothetical protein